MASFDETIRILVKADVQGAKRELEALGRTTQKSFDAKGPQKFTDKLKANAGTIASWGAGVAAAGAVAYDFALTASELEQSVGAVDTVFGAASDTIAEFSDTSARSFGISARAANQLTAQFGAMLTNMGYTQDEAANTSVSLTKLGADLSAAFGGSPEEAVQALASALRGERDPIERFGVSIKEADVNLRLARMGMKNATGEAKKHAQAVATLELIYDQTANVQGQFSRESDTMAGRLAVAKAEFEELQATIGTELLPVVTEAVSLFGDLTSVLESIPEGAKDGIGKYVLELSKMVAQWPLLTEGKKKFDELRDSTLFWKDALDAIPSPAQRAIMAVRAGMDDAEDSTRAVRDRTSEVREEQRRLFEEVTGRAESIIDRKSAWREVVRSGIELAQAQDDLTIKQAEYNAAVEEFGKDSPEAVAAARDVQLAFIGVSEVGGDAKQSIIDYGKAFGGLDENASAAKIGKTVSELERVRDTLAPGSPLRTWLDDYIRKLRDGIPPEVSTDIIIRNRIDQTGRFNNARDVPGRAIGGPVASDRTYLVGERGPELFRPSVPGVIIPPGRSRGGDGYAAPVTITINAGLGTDPTELERAVTQALANARRRGITV